MFSLAVLIGRGLDQVLHEFFFCFSLFSFQGIDTLYIDFLRNKEVYFLCCEIFGRRGSLVFRCAVLSAVCAVYFVAFLWAKKSCVHPIKRTRPEPLEPFSNANLMCGTSCILISRCRMFRFSAYRGLGTESFKAQYVHALTCPRAQVPRDTFYTWVSSVYEFHVLCLLCVWASLQAGLPGGGELCEQRVPLGAVTKAPLPLRLQFAFCVQDRVS